MVEADTFAETLGHVEAKAQLTACPFVLLRLKLQQMVIYLEMLRPRNLATH